MPVNQDLHHLLRTRRSIRRFKADPIPDSVIESILTTSTYAPSAHNRQPWRFAIVKQKARSVKSRLGLAITSKMREDMQAEGATDTDIEKRVNSSLRRIEEAPLTIILCRDVEDVRVDTEQEKVMGTQSVASAGLQLLLAAHAEGLGGNWICWPLYAPEAVRTVLDLPYSWEPQAMYFLGYPEEEPQMKERKSLNEIVKTFDD
ncbi:MAG: nitroreductase family protein [Anaerolineales bacterium]|nr:nitroreductase family protein [Anaerolineales bacterium]